MMAQQSPPTTNREESGELHTWRCWRCGRIVARLFLLPGCSVEIKCKCGAVNVAAVDNTKATA
jgi:phage FluMu protein Com